MKIFDQYALSEYIVIIQKQYSMVFTIKLASIA